METVIYKYLDIWVLKPIATPPALESLKDVKYTSSLSPLSCSLSVVISSGFFSRSKAILTSVSGTGAQPPVYEQLIILSCTGNYKITIKRENAQVETFAEIYGGNIRSPQFMKRT